MNEKVTQFFSGIKSALEGRYLVGQENLIKLLLTAYFARGHVLIEGPPGTGKTLTAKLLAHLLAMSFKRIQFTSDLLPGDILGAHIYSPASRQFEFMPGPIFSDIVLADEINRAPPRTQSALLEAMEERQVTVDGTRMELNARFFVIATQNPRDYEGTFALPEVQLDRFLFKVTLTHGTPETDKAILRLSMDGNLPPNFSTLAQCDLDPNLVDHEIKNVRVDDSVLEYTGRILAATRSHRQLSSGSSVRGGVALCRAARLVALMAGRAFVIPDDIKNLAAVTLAHRIRLTPEAQVSQITDQSIVEDIINHVPFPSHAG
jgi:MoxR-like ATPase